MIRSSIQKFSQPTKQWTRSLTVTNVKCAEKKLNEPEQIDTKGILTKEKKLAGYITIEKEGNVFSITGIRDDLMKGRRIRIYQPAKNAMQSGTNNIGHWLIEFDNKTRWENPLIGWVSTGDPLSNLKNEFRTREEAIAYCEKYGLDWYVSESKTTKPERVKSYGVNFSWNKRTRVSTK